MLFFRKTESDNGRSENYDFFAPTGAADNASFLLLCNKSYNCVTACPYEAIRVKRTEENSPFYGYPVIEPRTKPCYFCVDFPCIKACDSGALKEINIRRQTRKAFIDTNRCFAYNEFVCQTCFINCPETGAIFFNEENQPIINSELCTGCGICVHACLKEEPAINIKTH